jgi:hypothetical protein
MAADAAPLRFERAVLDGPLPAPPPGCVRVLSQTLSLGARLTYDSCARGWREQQAAARAAPRPVAGAAPLLPPWASIVSPLPDDCLAEADTILRSLRRHLQLPKVRTLAAAWTPWALP